MTVDSFEKLNSEHIDAFREVGNIGMGSTATALSVMINTPTDISIPDVRVIPSDAARNLLTAISGAALGMVIDITGDISGKLVHIIPSQFAQRVINTYYEKQITSWADLDDMDFSVIFEMTNITSAQFVNALSDLLGMFIDISTPRRCDNLSAEVGAGANNLLFINTSLIILENMQKDFMIFLPDANSLDPIIEKLKLNKLKQGK